MPPGCKQRPNGSLVPVTLPCRAACPCVHTHCTGCHRHGRDARAGVAQPDGAVAAGALLASVVAWRHRNRAAWTTITVAADASRGVCCVAAQVLQPGLCSAGSCCCGCCCALRAGQGGGRRAGLQHAEAYPGHAHQRGRAEPPHDRRCVCMCGFTCVCPAATHHACCSAATQMVCVVVCRRRVPVVLHDVTPPPMQNVPHTYHAAHTPHCHARARTRRGGAAAGGHRAGQPQL
jgi:hypothetical protein